MLRLGGLFGLQRLALEGHGVADGREHRVGLLELGGEGVDHAPVVLHQVCFPCCLSFRPGPGGFGHLDGQEEGEEIPNAEATAASLDGPRLASDRVLLVGAHPLDELEEGRLLASRTLKDAVGEDLQQKVIALHINQHVVAYDAQVCVLADVVSEQRVEVAVAGTHDMLQQVLAVAGQSLQDPLSRDIQVQNVIGVHQAGASQRGHQLLGCGLLQPGDPAEVPGSKAAIVGPRD
mmetsp:Transcript_32000/g.76310  ORF Transcript_32000/g.76310 Transcript_32000/m.76310 type:complete len:234 (+) Transcript_32000:277-978(+)